MSIDKYRFVSPGVQVAEIDLSRRTRPSAEPGPVIIGRFERGPTMVPTRVESLAELEELFGSARAKKLLETIDGDMLAELIDEAETRCLDMLIEDGS